MAVGSERGTTHLDVLAVDQLYVAGTLTGSFLKGTYDGDFVNDTITMADMKGTSLYALVGTIVGSQAHGLGVAPTAVMITPMMDFLGSMPYQRAAAGTLECYVSAGTTGTVQITALA